MPHSPIESTLKILVWNMQGNSVTQAGWSANDKLHYFFTNIINIQKPDIISIVELQGRIQDSPYLPLAKCNERIDPSKYLRMIEERLGNLNKHEDFSYRIAWIQKEHDANYNIRCNSKTHQILIYNQKKIIRNSNEINNCKNHLLAESLNHDSGSSFCIIAPSSQNQHVLAAGSSFKILSSGIFLSIYNLHSPKKLTQFILDEIVKNEQLFKEKNKGNFFPAILLGDFNLSTGELPQYFSIGSKDITDIRTLSSLKLPDYFYSGSFDSLKTIKIEKQYSDHNIILKELHFIQ